MIHMQNPSATLASQKSKVAYTERDAKYLETRGYQRVVVIGSDPDDVAVEVSADTVEMGKRKPGRPKKAP